MKVYVYCGIPGSGKTTLIGKRHPGAYVCSADHSFTDEHGVYRFDPSKLPAAHAACLIKYADAVRTFMDPAVIVVDNTNTTVAEIAPYAALALAYGHELHVVTVVCGMATAHARNTHGVSREAIEAMYQRLNAREMPPWWTQEVIHNV